MLIIEEKLKFDLTSQFQLMAQKRFLIYLLPALIVLNAVYGLGIYSQLTQKEMNQTSVVSQRIALDLSHILEIMPLSLSVENTSNRYLDTLNHYLNENEFVLNVKRIVNVKPKVLDERQVALEMNGINETIWVVIEINAHSYLQYVSVLPNVVALLLALTFINYSKHQYRKLKHSDDDSIDPCHLHINLFNKSLANPLTNKEVALANKPLCFYAALTDYCLNNPNAKLNPNKDLPEEFNRLCKKYFARLIELGHTIRKRPNFDNNLEKTLSEIRAALDEVYGDDLDSKELVYPKKAIGEGSRSKAHNFALIELRQEFIKVLGN